MICDLFIVFSSPSLTAPLKMDALTTSGIYLMINLIDITNIDKICMIKLPQNLTFLELELFVKHRIGRSKLSFIFENSGRWEEKGTVYSMQHVCK